MARDRPEGWAQRLGYAAAELLKLHAGRWEQELYCKELKVQIREGESLQSRTNETETREVAALLIAGHSRFSDGWGAHPSGGYGQNGRVAHCLRQNLPLGAIASDPDFIGLPTRNKSKG